MYVCVCRDGNLKAKCEKTQKHYIFAFERRINLMYFMYCTGEGVPVGENQTTALLFKMLLNHCYFSSKLHVSLRKWKEKSNRPVLTCSVNAGQRQARGFSTIPVEKGSSLFLSLKASCHYSGRRTWL